MDRVKVKLIAKHGMSLPGEEIECHPNLVPILIAQGKVADGEQPVVEAEKKEPKPKAQPKKKK